MGAVKYSKTPVISFSRRENRIAARCVNNASIIRYLCDILISYESCICNNANPSRDGTKLWTRRINCAAGWMKSVSMREVNRE